MEWSDAEIKLFINNKGPFNSYVINHCLKSCPLTLTSAVSNNLLPINATAPLINIIAPSINAPNTQLIETKATINYSRDLATLAKIYIEESKYSGEDNNFNRKLTIFNNLCDRVNIL